MLAAVAMVHGFKCAVENAALGGKAAKAAASTAANANWGHIRQVRNLID
jgi:hypothetical protein